jgi:Calx-beta domain/Putative binding domain, N-terminal/Bacterial pre-peptidase C-terminal domain
MSSTKYFGTRRPTARRTTLLAYACLLALIGVNFNLGTQATSAATKQQGPKLPSPLRKAGQVNPQQTTAKPDKGAKVLTVSPASTSCPNKTPIAPGATLNGTLSSGDCTLGDGSFFDEYTFSATAGQQVFVTLSSNDFDTYLFLLKPSETTPTQTTFQNDDGGTGGVGPGNTNSRIPAGSGVITLPETGTYSILANSFDPGATGNYSVSLTFSGTGGTVCPPNPTAITNGQTLNGDLSNTDCTLNDGSFFDAYSFTASANQQVSITLTGSFDTYLILLAPDGTDIAEDDNGGGGTTARIPAGSGFAVLPQTGTYTIYANSAAANQTGTYSISLSISNTNCPTTAITIGQSINGTLANTDCRLPADGSFLDAYTFSGTAGQQVAITLTSTSFDAFLILNSPTGTALASDDNSAGGTNARIPAATGFFALPTTGTYTIYANSAAANLTGNYTLTLSSSASCTYTLAQPSASVPAAGGNFSVGVTTQPGCDLTAAQVTSNASWLTVGTISATANGADTVNYTAAANNGTTARTGTLTIAGQTFTVTQDITCTYSIFPALRPFRDAGGTNGRLTVITNGGSCTWTATADVPWITITAGSTGTGTGRVRYTVAQNTDPATRTGHIIINQGSTNPITHTVTQTAVGTTPTVQFSAATYSVAENDPSNSAIITVTRTGDTAGAVTVDYATVDDPAAVPCDPTATAQRGTAYARCDYATTIDTLTFAPGETSKTFNIPLINDVHVEGNETFQIALSNPQGATLGGQTTATVTITDNDTNAPTTNPINGTPFFVRQQYLDFLSREPDPGGFSAWVGVLNRCPNVNNLDPNSPSAGCDRILVSSSFFGSPEFQLKGTFVFLFHKVSFGAASNPNYYPEYVDFAADLRRVTGATGDEVIAKRLDFTEDFVTRTAFVNRYSVMPNTPQGNAQYVDTLLANVNATLATPDPTSGVTRNSLVNDLNAGTKTRADVLRAIVESQEVNQKQFNFAFVATQYYGYLRRTPEPGGYQAWLNVLQRGDSFRTMVDGFMNSAEYRLRFGPNTLQ